MPPTFTCDTVSRIIASGPGSWLTHVQPLLRQGPEVHWLEVGSYEGRSALWAADNLLTGPGSTVTCVDPWHGWRAKKLFDENVAYRPEIVVKRGTSNDVLPTLPRRHYNGAYIDGSHTQPDVRRDIELVLPLLTWPAVIVFDDYDVDVPSEMPLADGVKPAVDEFLAREGRRVDLLHRGRQVIVKLLWDAL